MNPNDFRSDLLSLASRRFLAGLCAAALGVFLPAGALHAQGAAEAMDSGNRVDAETKTTIKAALKFLAQKQHLDGSWATVESKSGHPVAMTGYCLIAFMDAGNLPDQGEYAKNVAAGEQFLLDSIQPDGMFRDVNASQYMYNHGIATVALAELYGESHAPTLRPKLQKLIEVILKAQAPSGGWRYTPQPHDADISVTVLQAVALRAAQEAGFAVPQTAIDNAVAYVDSCYSEGEGGFCYQPGKGAGFARTAAAIYSLQVLGKYDDPRMKPASSYIMAHTKGGGGQWGAYGNFYAAPAQYMMGGDTWRTWYSQMKQNLNASVKKEGDLAYWEDSGSGKDLGPVYFTAVYVHVLSMPFHFVPLYQR